MNDGQSSTNNPTIPTTVGALLTEECSVNPLSPLPSFLELVFVDVARDSGRQALSAAFTMGVVWLESVLGRLQLLERRLIHHQMHHLSTSTHNNDHGSRMITTRVTNMLNTLRRTRIRFQRHICHTVLQIAKNLGPEIQTLILFAIDYHCIHYLSGSTACEMMYGIKRSKVVKQTVDGPKNYTLSSSSTPYNNRSKDNSINNNKNQGSNNSSSSSRIVELTKYDKTISALLAALLPYCNERCDMVYSQWQTDQQSSNDNNNNNMDSPNYAKQQIIKLYPYYHMIHEGSIFIYQFAYLMGYTVYWSSSLHAMGYVLRRMTVADVQQQQQQQQQQRKVLMEQQQRQHTPPLHESAHEKTTFFPPHISNATGGTISNAPIAKLSLSHLLKGAIVCSLSYTLISGWYSHFQRQLRIRRRRWIAGNDEDDNTLTNTATTLPPITNKLPIPPPPMPPKLLIDEDTTTTTIVVDRWSCPICNEVRINPTASTSGYVYCYKCLVLHIRSVGKYCPMTGMACNEENIVRLFEPTSLSSSSLSTRRHT
jgi:peroxin-12